jgi:hypothetical protein
MIFLLKIQTASAAASSVSPISLKTFVFRVSGIRESWGSSPTQIGAPVF